MLIGIISDSHDQVDEMGRAVALFNEKKAELVVHCGDWVSPFMPDLCKDLNCQLISVWGNNEGDKYRFLKRAEEQKWNIIFYDKSAELELDGKKVVVYHGEERALLESLVLSQQYDAVFTGHTHQAMIDQRGKTLVVNPGSISGQRSAKTGHEKTVAFYDTSTGQAEIISI